MGGFHLCELRHEVAVAGERLALSRRGRGEIAREHPDAVAQHPVVEEGRCAIENDYVDVVVAESRHEHRRELRAVPEVPLVGESLVNVDGNVDVAVRLSFPEGAGTKKIGLEDFPAWSQERGEALDEPLARDELLHCRIMVSRAREGKEFVPGGAAGRHCLVTVRVRSGR